MSKRKRKAEGDGKEESKAKKPNVEEEAWSLEKEVKKAEAREVLAGLTVKQLVTDLNSDSEAGLAHWRRLSTTPEGRMILYKLYRILQREQDLFLSVVQDYAKSSRLSLEAVTSELAPGDAAELESGLGYVEDLEKAADEQATDTYQLQVVEIAQATVSKS